MLNTESDENGAKMTPRPKVYIDEKKIDDCIEMLQNADPTGEIQPDTVDLLELEDQCYMMGPLIDKQLQHIDYKHVVLEDLNLKMMEAFQIYNNLMKESISKSSLGYAAVPPTLTGGVGAQAGPLRSGVNSIPYVAAPPLNSLDQSSLLLANQLNNIALNNSGFPPQNLQNLPPYDPNMALQQQQQQPNLQQYVSGQPPSFQNYSNEPTATTASAVPPAGQPFNPMYANMPMNANFANSATNGMLSGVPLATGPGQATGLVNPNFYK